MARSAIVAHAHSLLLSGPAAADSAGCRCASCCEACPDSSCICCADYTVTALSGLLLISLGLLAYTTSNRADCSTNSSTKGQSPGIAAAPALWGADTDPHVLKGLLAGLLIPQEATPDFLDAAVKSGLDKASIRQLAQLQQQAFCL